MTEAAAREMLTPFDEPPETDATRDAFDDPQIGDRFQEFYSFWMYVVHVDGEYVATVEASAPCTLPGDGKLRHFATRDRFRRAYGYGSAGMAGKYWVQLADRGSDVDGWYAPLLPDFPIPVAAVPDPAAPVRDTALVSLVGELLAKRFAEDGLGFMLPGDRAGRTRALLDALDESGFVVARREGVGTDV